MMKKEIISIRVAPALACLSLCVGYLGYFGRQRLQKMTIRGGLRTVLLMPHKETGGTIGLYYYDGASCFNVVIFKKGMPHAETAEPQSPDFEISLQHKTNQRYPGFLHTYKIKTLHSSAPPNTETRRLFVELNNHLCALLSSDKVEWLHTLTTGDALPAQSYPASDFKHGLEILSVDSWALSRYFKRRLRLNASQTTVRSFFKEGEEHYKIVAPPRRKKSA